jgi:hypothetical protein
MRRIRFLKLVIQHFYSFLNPFLCYLPALKEGDKKAKREKESEKGIYTQIKGNIATFSCFNHKNIFNGVE